MNKQDLIAARDEAMSPVEKNWRDTAAQYLRNQQFYSGLIDQASEALGAGMFTRDDGSLTKEPLRIKLPEVVAEVVNERDKFRKNVDDLGAMLRRVLRAADKNTLTPEFRQQAADLLKRLGCASNILR